MLQPDRIERRGMTVTQLQFDLDAALRRVRGEYLEMPGLRLTVAQAQRLWGLDPNVCDRLLNTLVESKFLLRTPDGAFVRVDTIRPAPHG